jgi:hypothetical protein
MLASVQATATAEPFLKTPAGFSRHREQAPGKRQANEVVLYAFDLIF